MYHPGREIAQLSKISLNQTGKTQYLPKVSKSQITQFTFFQQFCLTVALVVVFTRWSVLTLPTCLWISRRCDLAFQGPLSLEYLLLLIWSGRLMKMTFPKSVSETELIFFIKSFFLLLLCYLELSDIRDSFSSLFLNKKTWKHVTDPCTLE